MQQRICNDCKGWRTCKGSFINDVTQFLIVFETCFNQCHTWILSSQNTLLDISPYDSDVVHGQSQRSKNISQKMSKIVMCQLLFFLSPKVLSDYPEEVFLYRP